MPDHGSAGSSPDFSFVASGPGRSQADAPGGEGPASVPPCNPSVTALWEQFPDGVLRNRVCAGDEDVVYVDPERVTEILGWLHETPDQHYDHLADVTAVDYGGGRPIEVVYQLWSIPHRAALRVKCELRLDALEIDSVTGIWVGADWLEREVYDLFGVTFQGHPDLRRILMPDNYAEGHPLRKDFPLRGRFSRAEQTRRALTQDPEDQYMPGEIGGRTPQLVEEAVGSDGGAGGEEDDDGL
ncbi:MAG: NADH-quinone oxidoreductase subunit C [Gemmatimonadetes bacterium]|nr:NADH-quinone oxidoreductase subunit C [Gemmatimonadota bacterium]